MSQVYQDNSYTIGNTPLVRLNHIGNNCIMAKIESRNPSFSVKCRIGSNMIWAAEQKKLLHSNITLLEATSGNTGIALAYVAAARNYKLILTMPETMSIERRKLIQALGAEIILTDGNLGMRGAINRAKEIVLNDPKRYLWLQQFENPANPQIHEQTTGPEIWRDTNGEIDIFVSGVGTGGTITGVGKFLKTKKVKKVTIVAVEPEESPVITQTLLGQPITPSAHKIQGIGAGFIPKNLDLNIIDHVETINADAAINFAKFLMKKEGILAGISSGAALAAAIQLQKKENYYNKKIVIVLPSSGERYLSTTLFSKL